MKRVSADFKKCVWIYKTDEQKVAAAFEKAAAALKLGIVRQSRTQYTVTKGDECSFFRRITLAKYEIPFLIGEQTELVTRFGLDIKKTGHFHIPVIYFETAEALRKEIDRLL